MVWLAWEVTMKKVALNFAHLYIVRHLYVIVYLTGYVLHISARIISRAVGESNEEWFNVQEGSCIFEAAAAGLLFEHGSLFNMIADFNDVNVT